MTDGLLIVGAGMYGIVAKEIAKNMNCFEKIEFIDDFAKFSLTGDKVIGTTHNIVSLYSRLYKNIIVAIGNPDIRLQIIEKIVKETQYNLISLISSEAYISHSARIEAGCIVEPKAVIQAGSVLKMGCFVSAGAVINHFSICNECVHIDCNAVVAGCSAVPAKVKVQSGKVYCTENEK